MVLKPASLTPLSVLRYAELAVEAGIPAGALNVVPGPGATVGSALVEHPGVGKIGFTGSTEVGAGIARRAAATMKRVTLELGGKSACVVFADADLEKVGRLAPYAVFENCGQDCCARSRLIVAGVGRRRGGRALLRDGPQPARRDAGEPRHRDRAADLGRASARRSSATSRSASTRAPRLVTGGERPGGDLEAGFFYRPTVLAGVRNDMTVAREEIFGPVVSVITFCDEADAVRIANDTPYGLSGSLWTRDGARQLRVARALRTGVLGVNTNSSRVRADAVRRLQAVGRRQGARHGGARAQHRAEERLHLDRVARLRSCIAREARASVSAMGSPAVRHAPPTEAPRYTWRCDSGTARRSRSCWSSWQRRAVAASSQPGMIRQNSSPRVCIRAATRRRPRTSAARAPPRR